MYSEIMKDLLGSSVREELKLDGSPTRSNLELIQINQSALKNTTLDLAASSPSRKERMPLIGYTESSQISSMGKGFLKKLQKCIGSQE